MEPGIRRTMDKTQLKFKVRDRVKIRNVYDAPRGDSLTGTIVVLGNDGEAIGLEMDVSCGACHTLDGRCPKNTGWWVGPSNLELIVTDWDN